MHWRDSSLYIGQTYGWIEVIALLTCLLGLLIRIYTVGHTPANTSGRNTKTQVADTLNTTGIYSTVRHPLYVGNFFMWLGIAILTADLWFTVAFILAYYLYYERIMYAEEQFLTRKFGETYIQWAAAIPAFIPSFRSFVQPSVPFSWKKVLKKEKNGFFAIFVLFLLFNCWNNFVTTGSITPIKPWILYSTLVSGIIYFVLKFIKAGTKMLDEEGR